jgi:hypothetical protein
MDPMSLITHVNYMDQDGQIYCCLRNRVVKLDQQQQEQFCSGCKMFAGLASGQGVECAWEDMRNVSEPHIVTDPNREFITNQTRVVSLDSVVALNSFCS